MKMVEAGVLDNSIIHFQTPSKFAQNALYHSPQYGHFYCNQNYHIQRSPIDLYLLFYIKRGSLEISGGQNTVTACEGSVVLLDCHVDHEYSCPNYAEFYWIHFSGCSSPQYCSYLTEQFGTHFSAAHVKSLEQKFHSFIYSSLPSGTNEHVISTTLHDILANLAAPKSNSLNRELPISPAIEYIHKHYAAVITLDTLAQLCHMSVYHFIRIFKRHLNVTPHEYLLSYRLNQAKHMLHTSSFSIENIAIECGFNSASHFARAFKANTQITPAGFRKMRF